MHKLSQTWSTQMLQCLDAKDELHVHTGILCPGPLGLVQVCGENDHQDEVLWLKRGQEHSRAMQSKSKAIQRVKRCQEMSRAKPSVPSVLRSLQLSCIAMHCYASLPRLFRIAAVLLMRRISDSTFSSASSSTKSVLESQHRVKKKGKDWIQSSSQRSSAF